MVVDASTPMCLLESFLLTYQLLCTVYIIEGLHFSSKRVKLQRASASKLARLAQGG